MKSKFFIKSYRSNILLFLLFVLMTGVGSCTNEQKNESIQDHKADQTNLPKTTPVNTAQIVDSITSSESFFQSTSEIQLPYSVNLNGDQNINLSKFLDGKYKGKQLMPLSVSYINTIEKIAYKRYINEAIKKYYSSNSDIASFLSKSNSHKFYALGKIVFKENNLASQIIYQEVVTENGVNKFLIMVNFDTSFKVFLHSALLAIDINESDSKIKLGSDLSNGDNMTLLIKQKLTEDNKAKDINIEINKAFYYAPPSEGGPNPKDYIRYF